MCAVQTSLVGQEEMSCPSLPTKVSTYFEAIAHSVDRNGDLRWANSQIKFALLTDPKDVCADCQYCRLCEIALETVLPAFLRICAAPEFLQPGPARLLWQSDLHVDGPQSGIPFLIATSIRDFWKGYRRLLKKELCGCEKHLVKSQEKFVMWEARGKLWTLLRHKQQQLPPTRDWQLEEGEGTERKARVTPNQGTVSFVNGANYTARVSFITLRQRLGQRIDEPTAMQTQSAVECLKTEISLPELNRKSGISDKQRRKPECRDCFEVGVVLDGNVIPCLTSLALAPEQSQTASWLQQCRLCYLQAGLLQCTPLQVLFEEDLDALAGATCVFLATSEFASACWTKERLSGSQVPVLLRTVFWWDVGIATWYLQQIWEPFDALPLPRYAALYPTGTEEGLGNINLATALPVSLPNSSRVLVSCHLYEHRACQMISGKNLGPQKPVCHYTVFVYGAAQAVDVVIVGETYSFAKCTFTESQNGIGWKRPLRSSSPTINLTLPKPPLHHVPEHLIQMAFKYLQGWGLQHCPGQPGPMLDNPFSEEKFPNIQSKPPLAQLEAISSLVESDEVSPQPPFLQAEQPQLPQPLPISLVLQTLPQLRCPSLDTLQPLHVSLGVRGPKLNTAFEVRPHQCRVQGHDHFPSPAGHANFDTSQDAIGFLGHLGTLLAHIQPAVDQHPQVLLCLAAFQPLFPKDAEQPQLPQPLPISLVLQTLPQLRCPSLDTLQPLNVSLGVGGPTLNTAFEVLSILRALAWRVEIKAAACYRKASAGPSKAFGFISTAYFELIARNQNSVVVEDLRSQGNHKEGRGRAGKFKRTQRFGVTRTAARAELFVPMAAEEEGGNELLKEESGGSEVEVAGGEEENEDWKES
ncbi:hypothetical protein QYF61_026961 [Mycteria americana]|uniref:Uncharacterized protein n=1 Tax=Mycteria americana TaxID=33587 RepID=A0AAN7NDC9_MYCAM|nr:hypothetical protein QYF61_026961 [Mycteria americana]